VDAAFERAVNAGAKAIMPPTDVLRGDRFGTLTDHFGHGWAIFDETADQRSVLFCRHGVLSWRFEREKGTYAECLVRRLTASLSLAGPEQYIGLDLEFAIHEERCHPPPYVFSHGLSSGGREPDEQLAVASTAGLERLPVLIEGLESMCATLSRETNRFQLRPREQSFERVGIGESRGLVQESPLLREVATEFVHEDPEERHAFGRGPDADCKSTASTQNASPFSQSRRWIWQEHQAELTDHCIEAPVSERERLPVHQE
jgi:hypothetical protein